MPYDPTLFNVDPYYDDFNEDKKFLRVMFKPGYALQAREVTQIQTILQNQIERFGSNIFENQVIDIENINFKDSLEDETRITQSKVLLIDRVKMNEWSDAYSMTISLRFYVKGLPNFKIEDTIKSVLEQHAKMITGITDLLKKSDNSIDMKINLEKSNSYLKEITIEINRMRVELAKKENYENNYKDSIKYLAIFNKIQEKIPELVTTKTQDTVNK